MSHAFKKNLKRLLYGLLVIAAIYGSGRLYYRVTGGFTESNITSNLPYDRQWDIRPLTPTEQQHVDTIVSQPFSYLGKGCQSYVFQSQDGNYVIKFFKYQRFRPQAWLDYVAFIPAIDQYRLRKIEEKRLKLENIFRSWKLAFEELQPQTGLVFVHLNKSNYLKKTLTIYDKIGMEHRLDLDQMEFLIQRKAQPLCASIKTLMDQGNLDAAQVLLSRIITLVLSENARGLADNDHALMQNTGVLNGMPIHIDVGQFVHNEEVKKPDVYKQELFSKTFKFRRWLRKTYPELADYLETELRALIGEQFNTMQPRLKTKDEGALIGWW